MIKLTRDRTAEAVLRDQILRREQGQGNIHFPCSADHEEVGNRLIYTLLYKGWGDYTYIHVVHTQLYMLFIHIYNKWTVYSSLFLIPFELKIRREPYVPITVCGGQTMGTSFSLTLPNSCSTHISKKP